MASGVKRRNPPRSVGPRGYSIPRAVLLCACGHETKVTNSRGTLEGDIIRRERACRNCERLFTSYESMNDAARLSPYLERLEAALGAALTVIAEIRRRNL